MKTGSLEPSSKLKTKPLILLLAWASMFFAMLLPPEAYPNGKLAVVLCATFAFLSALSERHIPQAYLHAGLWIFGLLVIHTWVVSIDLYRSLDTLTAIWAYYCLVGVFIYESAGYEDHLAGLMVILSLIVSGYGIYQYFWGFDKVYQYIFYAGSDQIVKAPALDVVATRRVFSTVALPGTLWGFLVCAVPFHAMLWRRRLAVDLVLVVSALMLLATGFLTRSFGFLLGLLILISGAVWMRYRKLVWNRITPVLIALILIAGLFYSARHGVIEGSNPAGLRALNWVSAWNIFAVHPLGTGLNTFGVIYPEYMQPNANETQYAHNTVLQLLSELGYPLILAVVIVLVIKANAFKGSIRWDRQASIWLFLGVLVWIAHNLIDIDVYFPSVGVIGAVLIGSLFARESVQTSSCSKALVAFAGICATFAIAFSTLACISTELQARAQIEYESKKLKTAVDTLAEARRICPIDSSLYHDSGEILLELYQTTHEPRYLAEATETFRKAILLSPKKSGSYIGYGLTLSSANRLSEAMDEIRIAQTLYPSSSYVQAIARLIGRRLQ
jgi:hypothetical protein